MTMPMAKCKRWLGALWFGVAALLFLILFLQTTFGHYGDNAELAWRWLLPSIMPTLSLVIGVLVADAMGQPVLGAADSFLFKLTFSLSSAYLLALLLVLLLQPVAAVDPIRMINESNVWLGPFQGLVAAALGVFFVKAPGAKADK